METKKKLDKGRDYGIIGCREFKFFSQDGKLFDMGTLEEVSPPEEPKPKPPSRLTCKFCGAERSNPELMREHLLALHREAMEKSKIDKVAQPDKFPSHQPEPQTELGKLTEKVEDMKKEADSDKSAMITVESALHHREPEPVKRKPGRHKKIKGDTQ